MVPRRGGWGYRRGFGGWGRPYRRPMWGYRRPLGGWGVPLGFRRPFIRRGGGCGMFSLMFSAFVMLGVLALLIR